MEQKSLFGKGEIGMSSVLGYVLFVLGLLVVLAAFGFLIWFFGVRNKKNKNQMQDGAMERKEYAATKLHVQASSFVWKH